ncbi:MAG: Sodium/hydrogen exchanger [Candidatus Woesebacteria bacterium GW2011_GWB1_38_5b]|uniref:Sodium/hydrogen exchanger n=1 Tax=Candidatus Woesebacteria bacterium GW2011_GWB1_38_5b TaxID=1618569 RepID=A0A0G0NFH1_9BACT|nr:MAG: Sodium/hydrogen exchanger [Candidatus Woesebacteria bacterium GW2011_GWB1_38_5b]
MDFTQISILLVAAAAAGVLAKSLRQPVFVGYLFAGFLLALFGFLQKDSHSLQSLGQIGVTLLLFLVGLEMNIHEFSIVGKVALLSGIGQVVLTTAAGFLIASLLGFGTVSSLYIAFALTLSSTIIIMKLLSEKKDINSLYGKIAVGILLVQDFVAVLILMFLAGFRSENFGFLTILLVALKALILFLSVWYLSKNILPNLFTRFISNSNELLYIVSIAWALGFATLVAGPFGFSIEIGGFLAGLALSNLPEHLQVASKTRWTRDFFLTIFFLVLGTQLVVSGIGPIIPLAIGFALFVLIVNPLIVLILVSALGYKRRTGFLAGLTVAQVSEFSLIIMAMGKSLGHVGNTEVVLVVLVGVITMTLSTYMILGGEKIFQTFKKYLLVFRRKSGREPEVAINPLFNDHIVLVGCDSTGGILAKTLKKLGVTFVVVDFNPKVYKRLLEEKTPVIFGDLDEEEVLEASGVRHARLIISTISNLHDNLVLLEYLGARTKSIITVFTATDNTDAKILYKKGASLLVMPKNIAGEYVKHILKTYRNTPKKVKRLGKNHNRRLLAI